MLWFAVNNVGTSSGKIDKVSQGSRIAWIGDEPCRPWPMRARVYQFFYALIVLKLTKNKLSMAKWPFCAICPCCPGCPFAQFAPAALKSFRHPFPVLMKYDPYLDRRIPTKHSTGTPEKVKTISVFETCSPLIIELKRTSVDDLPS